MTALLSIVGREFLDSRSEDGASGEPNAVRVSIAKALGNSGFDRRPTAPQKRDGHDERTANDSLKGQGVEAKGKRKWSEPSSTASAEPY